MSEPTRSFPDRPSLRYLRLEAKRRVSAGEFPALHEAQLAIAREHGLSSWTALKQFLESQPRPAGHAVEQLSWVISRFAGADRPAWVAPADEEMRQHFDDRFLSKIPPGNLVTTLARKAESFREELVVTFDGPLQARAQLSGSLQVHTSVEAEPPHRLTGLRFDRLGTEVTDTRTAAATTRTSGDVPASVAGVADEALSELGLVGLILAGGGPHTPVWAAARGWADLDRGEALETGHQFPAYSITVLVTSTAVLRLVADGRVGLDDPVNDHLRTVRLADDTVTVRELLTHTGGVDSAARKFADSVPALVSLFGPVIACGGDRGTAKPSNGGYAALGNWSAMPPESRTRTRWPAWCWNRSVWATRRSRSAGLPRMPMRSPATTWHPTAPLCHYQAKSPPCRPSAACGPPRPTWCASASRGRLCSPGRWPARRSGRRPPWLAPECAWASGGISTNPAASWDSLGEAPVGPRPWSSGSATR
jgi:hypothetical protein